MGETKVHENRTIFTSSMNFKEAIERACQEPTLLDAQTWICIWESERAIKQARENYGSGTDGAGWDTCFKICLKEVTEEYWKRNDRRINPR